MRDTAPEYRFTPAADRRVLRARIEHEPYERLRNAVGWLRQQGAPATVEQELSDAVARHASLLEQRHNGGQPFPELLEWLRPGRMTGVHGRFAQQIAAAEAETVDDVADPVSGD